MRVAVVGLTPVQRPVTSPLWLSNTNAAVPSLIGLMALRPPPTSFAASGMRAERPNAPFTGTPLRAMPSAPL